MFHQRYSRITVGLLVAATLVSTSFVHENSQCISGLKYCDLELRKFSKIPFIHVSCHENGGDWKIVCFNDDHECEVSNETLGWNVKCFQRCNPESVYCGFQLLRMGWNKVYPDTLYRCKNSSWALVIQNCLGSCTFNSTNSWCRQECEPGSVYCGSELNSLEGWGRKYTSNSLYICSNTKTSVTLLTNCHGGCTTSTGNSFCRFRGSSKTDGCQSISRIKRVLGGNKADANEWPWMVSIRQYGFHFCGGALIASEWILTAAHCVEEIGKIGMEVVLGNRSPNRYIKGELRLNINRIIIHEDYYNGSLENDIALLRLATSVTFSNHIRPLCLSKMPIDNAKECVMAGWGDTGSASRPSVLQVGKASIMPTNECLDRFVDAYGPKLLALNLSQFICTVKQNIDDTGSCKGDSGGPLMCRNEQGNWDGVGVTSWGAKNACSSLIGAMLPSGFLRVSKHFSWIERIAFAKPFKIGLEDYQLYSDANCIFRSATSYILIVLLCYLVIFIK